MFFLVDKPIGMTSFDVIRNIRKNLGVRKVGHTGTLDPLASGLLLIATGRSTKLIPFLENAKKRYEVTIELSGKSESYDLGTEIIPIDTKNLQYKTDEEIGEYLYNLKSQIPPKYSALHINGKRAYQLAREGEDFSLKERPISIYDVHILSRGDTTITIELTVSSGCYIRSLAPMIGKFLGVEGGYISYLRRTGIYTDYRKMTISEASSLDNLEDIHYSKIFPTFPTIEIDSAIYRYLLEGKQVDMKILCKKNYDEGEKLFLLCREKSFLSFGEIKGGKYIIIKNDVY